MKLFNRPWMDKCNPDLIYRYWIHKGCPDNLLIRKYGLNILYVPTIFGIVTYIV